MSNSKDYRYRFCFDFIQQIVAVKIGVPNPALMDYDELTELIKKENSEVSSLLAKFFDAYVACFETDPSSNDSYNEIADLRDTAKANLLSALSN